MTKNGSRSEKHAFTITSLKVKVKGWSLPTSTSMGKISDGIMILLMKDILGITAAAKIPQQNFENVWRFPFEWPT